MVTSSVVPWYGGNLVAKACKTYWARPGGRCLGLSLYGLAQGFQPATVTRRLAAGLDIFEGRSRYNSLFLSGRPSGWFVAGKGATAMMMKGPVQLRKFLFENFVISVYAQSLSDGGGGIV